MKIEKHPPASSRLYLRLTPEKKDEIFKTAAAHGYGAVTTFILAKLDEQKNVNVSNNNIALVLKPLLFEFNRIGININQAVAAMHLLHINKAYNPAIITSFTKAVNDYISQRDILILLLEQLTRP